MMDTQDSPPVIPVDLLMDKIRKELDSNKLLAFDESYPTYDWGKALEFGKRERQSFFLLDGWVKPSEGFCWTLGEASTLAIKLPSRYDNLLLSINAHPLVGNHIKKQDVCVEWNGKPISEWSIDRLSDYHAIVLNREIEKNINILTFSIRSATSPKMCGIGDDDRVIGIGVHHLSVTPLHSF